MTTEQTLREAREFILNVPSFTSGRRDMLAKIDAALAAAAPAVPEGWQWEEWQMVPKVPTQKMLIAARAKYVAASASLAGFSADRLTYAALLAAAPTATPAERSAYALEIVSAKNPLRGEKEA